MPLRAFFFLQQEPDLLQLPLQEALGFLTPDRLLDFVPEIEQGLFAREDSQQVLEQLLGFLGVVLGEQQLDLPESLLQFLLQDELAPAAVLLVLALLFVHHWNIQQGEQRQAARAYSRRYALFPVLILVPESLPTDQAPPVDFGTTLALALEREMPGLPIAMHVYTSGAPDETLSAAKAVIIPSSLLARPPESITLWLQGYSGAKLVIPVVSRDWHWLGSDHNLAYLARRAACKVRVLAENSGNRRS